MQDFTDKNCSLRGTWTNASVESDKVEYPQGTYKTVKSFSGKSEDRSVRKYRINVNFEMPKFHRAWKSAETVNLSSFEISYFVSATDIYFSIQKDCRRLSMST